MFETGSPGMPTMETGHGPWWMSTALAATVTTTTASQAGPELAYTVAADGDGMALLVFDTRDGSTVNSYPLERAAGFPVGVSLGSDRSVIAATSAGQVYGFRAD